MTHLRFNGGAVQAVEQVGVSPLHRKAGAILGQLFQHRPKGRPLVDGLLAGQAQIKDQMTTAGASSLSQVRTETFEFARVEATLDPEGCHQLFGVAPPASGHLKFVFTAWRQHVASTQGSQPVKGGVNLTGLLAQTHAPTTVERMA